MSKKKDLALAEIREHYKPNIREIRSSIAPTLNDEEFSRFLYECYRKEINPLDGLIVPVKFSGRASSGRMSFIITRDYCRIAAENSGKYNGKSKTEFFYDKDGKLTHCTLAVYRKDCEHPFWETARMDEYNTGRNMWARMPHTMLEKVCEVKAFRSAFPNLLSGLYGTEEMDQAREEQKAMLNITPSDSDNSDTLKAPVNVTENGHKVAESKPRKPRKKKEPSEAKSKDIFMVKIDNAVEALQEYKKLKKDGTDIKTILLRTLGLYCKECDIETKKSIIHDLSAGTQTTKTFVAADEESCRVMLDVLLGKIINYTGASHEDL